MFWVFLVAVLSIVVHEWAHGFVANLRGDPTAKNMGRLSLNPLVHIDLFGTIILPILLYTLTGFAFGWAKPVPIDPGYFKNIRRDIILVALAGPLSNFIMAFLGVWWFSPFLSTGSGPISEFFVLFNISIGLFNLIPILPLDGGRVLGELLPKSIRYTWHKSERFGLMLVLVLMIILPKSAPSLSIPKFLWNVNERITQAFISLT